MMLEMTEQEYQAAVLRWRRSLSDAAVRELASEWKNGSREPAAMDAAMEAMHRWPTGHVARAVKRQGAQGSTLNDVMSDYAVTA